MTQLQIATDTFPVFGTTAVLLVSDPRAVGQARKIADGVLADIDHACSRFRPDSELSQLNAAGGRAVTISATFTALISAALRAARLTGGDVDPTCARALLGLGYDRDFDAMREAEGDESRRNGPLWPVGPIPGWRCVHLDPEKRRVRLERGAQIDLGATAKAWAADKCAEQIASRLDCGTLISLGGDIAVAGTPPADDWQVRVTDDHAAPQNAPGQTVTISSGGLATSSTTVRTWKYGGRQVHHIIDPATGDPVRSCWRTVSVAAGSCVDANTASTAAIIRGAAAPDWLYSVGLPARLVRQDGTVQTTAGWPDDSGPGEAA